MTHMQHLDDLLLGIFFFILVFLLPASPPHDGLRLVLLAAKVVSVGQTGSPHHLPANEETLVESKKLRTASLFVRRRHDLTEDTAFAMYLPRVAQKYAS